MRPSSTTRVADPGAIRVLSVFDIGCGAGRNAVLLACSGARVIGTDLSWLMLLAAAGRETHGRLHLAHAPMDAPPVRDRASDLIVAHGIWNLAGSGIEFRRAVRRRRVLAAPERDCSCSPSRATRSGRMGLAPGERFVFTRSSPGCRRCS